MNNYVDMYPHLTHTTKCVISVHNYNTKCRFQNAQKKRKKKTANNSGNLRTPLFVYTATVHIKTHKVFAFQELMIQISMFLVK